MESKIYVYNEIWNVKWFPIVIFSCDYCDIYPKDVL